MESRDPLYEVSVSKDFSLGVELFVSRLCIGYFLWSFARSSFKKQFLKLIVQNLVVQRGQWLSFLCCYVVCEMEKTICPLPRLTFILNSIKNVHAPMKPQHVISAARGWECFAKDYLWSAFQSTLLKQAEVSFVLGNADFFKFKMASELFWGKVLLIRVLCRGQIMRHGWSLWRSLLL